MPLRLHEAGGVPDLETEDPEMGVPCQGRPGTLPSFLGFQSFLSPSPSPASIRPSALSPSSMAQHSAPEQQALSKCCFQIEPVAF